MNGWDLFATMAVFGTCIIGVVGYWYWMLFRDELMLEERSNRINRHEEIYDWEIDGDF